MVVMASLGGVVVVSCGFEAAGDAWLFTVPTGSPLFPICTARCALPCWSIPAVPLLFAISSACSSAFPSVTPIKKKDRNHEPR